MPASLAAGCGEAPRDAGSPPAAIRPPGAAAGPALCGVLRRTVAGRVPTPPARELSGLAVSRVQRGVLWSHNDSGDSPRLFALRPDASVAAEVTLADAGATDWEDVAVGPARDRAGSFLWAGDIGSGGGRRDTVQVYRLPEPRLAELGGGARGPAVTTTRPAERITLRWPAGPRDAEALLIDPVGRDIVIVTKADDLRGRAEVYAAPAAVPASGEVALRRIARLELGPAALVTAADSSASGAIMALRTYGGVAMWARRGREPLGRTLRRRPCGPADPLAAEPQGEALALFPDGRGMWTVSEGERPALYRYAARGD